MKILLYFLFIRGTVFKTDTHTAFWHHILIWCKEYWNNKISNSCYTILKNEDHLCLKGVELLRVSFHHHHFMTLTCKCIASGHPLQALWVFLHVQRNYISVLRNKFGDQIKARKLKMSPNQKSNQPVKNPIIGMGSDCFPALSSLCLK